MGSVEILSELQVQSVVCVDAGPPKVSVAPVCRGSPSVSATCRSSILLEVLEATLHAPSAHRSPVSQSPEEHDSSNTPRRTRRNAPHSECSRPHRTSCPSNACKAFARLDTAVRRALLDLSVSLLPTDGLAGIGASGVDRSQVSKH